MELQIWKSGINVVETGQPNQPLLHLLMSQAVTRFFQHYDTTKDPFRLDDAALSVVKDFLERETTETPMDLVAQLVKNTTLDPETIYGDLIVKSGERRRDWTEHGIFLASTIVARQVENFVQPWVKDLILNRSEST